VIDACEKLDQNDLADIEKTMELIKMKKVDIKKITMDDGTRKLLATLGMIVVAILIIALAGEVAKYVMPAGILYFLLVNKVYILVAALSLLLLGIDKINMNSVRNMTGLSVLAIIGIVIAWQLDKIASGALWNGMYSSVYGRIPGNYLTLSLQAIDVIAIALGALGAFLVLLKVLDRVKDSLVYSSKPSLKDEEKTV
jgi:hypothetical protein